MLKITCKQRSAKGKRNTRDLQVHASNANAAPAQAQKNLRRFSRPGQHIPRCEERKPPLQTPVSRSRDRDLAICRFAQASREAVPRPKRWLWRPLPRLDPDAERGGRRQPCPGRFRSNGQCLKSASAPAASRSFCRASSARRIISSKPSSPREAPNVARQSRDPSLPSTISVSARTLRSRASTRSSNVACMTVSPFTSDYIAITFSARRHAHGMTPTIAPRASRSIYHRAHPQMLPSIELRTTY